MNATISYLEQLKASNGAASDYRAAQLLGVTHQTISQWRNKGTQMRDDTAVKVASLLGLRPIQILARIHMEQAKSEEVRQVWESLSNEIETAH